MTFNQLYPYATTIVDTLVSNLSPNFFPSYTVDDIGSWPWAPVTFFADAEKTIQAIRFEPNSTSAALSLKITVYNKTGAAISMRSPTVIREDVCQNYLISGNNFAALAYSMQNYAWYRGSNATPIVIIFVKDDNGDTIVVARDPTSSSSPEVFRPGKSTITTLADPAYYYPGQDVPARSLTVLLPFVYNEAAESVIVNDVYQLVQTTVKFSTNTAPIGTLIFNNEEYDCLSPWVFKR